MQRFRIFHETEYLYTNTVNLGPHRLLVRPRDDHDVRIESSRLSITPSALVSWHRDELDNSVALATFDAPTTRLVITSEVVVTHYLSDRQDLPMNDAARQFPISYTPREQLALNVCLACAAQDDDVRRWVDGLVAGHTETLPFLRNLLNEIHEHCAYETRREEGVQEPGQTLREARGSCRDYAWLFIVACRQAGLAARFVSGYAHSTELTETEGTTHAWAEVYLPGAGWAGFDPTCNLLTEQDHIPVFVALTPEGISPVSGYFTGAIGETPTMTVRVAVNLC